MTPEERAEYLRQWRKRHPSHYKRGVETYVCPVCGRTDTADGSERAQSGLCLDCWCARENRKTDARLRERIEDLRNRREERGAGLREFHEAGEIVEVRPAPSPDEERRRKVKEYNHRYYLAHKEQAKAYREAHREAYREACRRYRESHREERREAKRKYMKAHPEKNREAQRRYRLAHPEAQRRHYEAHKEEIKARVMAWQRAHPEKRHEYYLVRKLKLKQKEA